MKKILSKRVTLDEKGNVIRIETLEGDEWKVPFLVRYQNQIFIIFMLISAALYFVSLYKQK